MRSLDLANLRDRESARAVRIALKFLPADHSQTESFVVDVQIAPFTDPYGVRSLAEDLLSHDADQIGTAPNILEAVEAETF